jgi:hypothetical protein
MTNAVVPKFDCLGLKSARANHGVRSSWSVIGLDLLVRTSACGCKADETRPTAICKTKKTECSREHTRVFDKSNITPGAGGTCGLE